MQHLPTISVNIPLITNGNADIVLKSIRGVDYPQELIEIIIIEGNQIARQRNKGIKHSHGEIIYMLDNDSQVHPKSFKIIAREFKHKKVAAVGGPSLTPQNKKNYISQLIGCVLETHFGALRMRLRYSRHTKHTKTNEYHLIGANLALRKKYVTKIKGFNEKIVPNEETELLRRLKDRGYTLKYNEKLYIFRDQRKNLIELSKQFQHYGRGRVKQIFYTPNIQDFAFITPVLFGIYILSLLFYHPMYYVIPLGVYLLLAIATAAKASLKYKRLSLLFSMPFVFPIIHLSYAAGMVDEVIKAAQTKLFAKQSKRIKTHAKLIRLKLLSA